MENDGSSLPVQLETFELARDVARRVRTVRLSASELASSIDDAEVRRRLRVAQDPDIDVGDMTSCLDAGNMRHRFGVCLYVLTTKGMAELIASIARYLEQFVGTLYPERLYVWSEVELESAKAEAAFARRALDSILGGAHSAAPELRGLCASVDVLNDILLRVTYQGQAMELLAQISAVQLKLISQQAEVLDRFDKQNKEMERMNRWINRFSIGAFFVALAALVFQVLDVFHLT